MRCLINTSAQGFARTRQQKNLSTANTKQTFSNSNQCRHSNLRYKIKGLPKVSEITNGSLFLFSDFYLKFSSTAGTDGCVLPYSVGKSQHRFATRAFFVNMGFVVPAFFIKFGFAFKEVQFLLKKPIFSAACL